MTQQKLTLEQQLNHLKVKFADVTLANMAMQEQMSNMNEAMLAMKAELEESRKPDTTPKKESLPS